MMTTPCPFAIGDRVTPIRDNLDVYTVESVSWAEGICGPGWLVTARVEGGNCMLSTAASSLRLARQGDGMRYAPPMSAADVFAASRELMSEADRRYWRELMARECRVNVQQAAE